MNILGQTPPDEDAEDKCENWAAYATANVAGSPAVAAAVWLADCYGDDVAAWANRGAAAAGRTVAEYVNYWFDNEEAPPLDCRDIDYRDSFVRRTYRSCVTRQGQAIHCRPDERLERVGIFIPRARSGIRRAFPPIADRICIKLLHKPPQGCPEGYNNFYMGLISESPRARLRRRFQGISTHACSIISTPRPGPTYRPTPQDRADEAAHAVTGSTHHGLLAESRTRLESARGLVSTPKKKTGVVPLVVVAAVLAIAWRARRG